MKIIGHRGAAGLALENTKESFRLARKYKVDAIELDVRLTKDKQLAVIHDAATDRIADQSVRVRSVTMRQLQTIALRNDEHILSLREVLELRGKTPLIIELKDANSAELLLKTISREKGISVASKRYQEIRTVKKKRPEIPVFLVENTKPIEVLQRAAFIKADGIGLNHWLLNPLTYYMARRQGLEIYVYTVNYRFVVWFLRMLYPKLSICTNYPNRFVKNSTKRPIR